MVQKQRQIVFSPISWQEYLSWQTEDRKTLKKINQLIQSIQRDGMATGLGKPEPLKNELSGLWSRRINQQDRLVYVVTDQAIEIVSCKTHYQ
ncbi:Txe/YoeB family addiction module toxin [Loigolactobacillus coryniformis]|uniref:Txe/YoeB family addiction module toxin n=1 Tax=Loigolactobacillus coryniformis TaxID=1610 RepID=UPI0002ECC405|nr:Txe/YoeB family addiction module toxin [Loigolactobacillus coryniformis]